MTIEKLKTAVKNINTYLEECHNENDTITLTAKVLKSIKENYEELIEFKNKTDFVEVVRCKDCKHVHWNQETCHGKPIYYCDRTDLQVHKYSFCSYGERK